MAGFYLFILFTGLRRESAAEIRWEHVDLDKGTLLIPKPKGGKKRAFTLPLSDLPIEILLRWQVENEKLTPDSPWAFSSDKSKTGHIAEPKLTPAQKASLVVPFSVHGLRHTWITAANAAGLSPYDIKMLTNHMLPKGDVTAGYIGLHMEALRASQQRVTDYLRNLICPRPIACPLSNQIGRGLGLIKRCGDRRVCVKYYKAIASCIPLRTCLE